MFLIGNSILPLLNGNFVLLLQLPEFDLRVGRRILQILSVEFGLEGWGDSNSAVSKKECEWDKWLDLLGLVCKLCYSSYVWECEDGGVG